MAIWYVAFYLSSRLFTKNKLTFPIPLLARIDDRDDGRSCDALRAQSHRVIMMGKPS